MRYDEYFKEEISEVNEMDSPEVEQALEEYNGRSIVLKVKGDATYVFNISKEGIDYELNPVPIPDDM